MQKKDMYRASIVNSHIKKFIKHNIKIPETLSFLHSDIMLVIDTVSANRERAYLMKITSELTNPKNNIVVDLLAVVIEMQIIAAYLKDDILDNNSVRNGHQTANSKYDIKRTTIYSDLFLNISYLALEKIRQLIPEAQYKEIFYKINESYQSISLGQIETTCFDYTKPNLISSINLLYERLVGIAFGNYCCLLVSPDNVIHEKLFLFGKNVGIALQVKNDIDDFILEPSLSGIPAYQDLLQAHPNIVIAYLLEYQKKLSQKEINLLRSLLSRKYWKKELTENDENMIIDMLEKTNALSKSLSLYNKLMDNCLKSLSYLKDERIIDKYTNFLKTLI